MYAGVRLFPSGEAPSWHNLHHFDLGSPKLVNKVGPILPGIYDGDLHLLGFRHQPSRFRVEIKPYEKTPLRVQLEPEGVVYSVLQIGRSPVPLRRVILSGPGVERVIEEDPTADRSPLFRPLGFYGDAAYRHSFEFHNLPAGVYDLRVEVDGFETWEGQRTVVSGQGRREDVRMRPSE